jgi:cytochrome c-type biogenesis protein CcmE
MPKRVVIVLVIVVVFGVFMFSSLIRSCSPHVGFEKAKSGERVQVYGSIVTDDIKFDSSTLILSFTLEDETGNVLPIRYAGVVPSNFEYAREATCAGQWEGDWFRADRLLLKCPSKYEGEVEDDSIYQFYNGDQGI